MAFLRSLAQGVTPSVAVRAFHTTLQPLNKNPTPKLWWNRSRNRLVRVAETVCRMGTTWRSESGFPKPAKRIALAVVVGGALLFVDSRSKIVEFDRRISSGTCNKDPSKEDKWMEGHIVDRSELVKEIVETFIRDKSHGFGVILGPTGTGKTFAIKQACHNSAKGSLYIEIRGVEEFPLELAKAIGMRTEPNLIGTLLGRFFPSSIQGYYKLPLKYEQCVDNVIRILGERATIFKKKNGYAPCLFIDGVDLLAKHNHEAFIKLVDLAKGYANEGILKIIFGCSEGHIIPLIYDATSSNSRCLIMEVLDLGEKEAMGYLISYGIGEALAARLVNEIGTRMVFLERAVKYNDLLKPKCKSEDEMFEQVVGKLEVQFTRRGVDAAIQEMPRSIDIIDYLLNVNDDIGFSPCAFFKRYADEQKRKAFQRSVTSLIENNTFRYTGRGNITWYSHLMKKNVKKELFEKKLGNFSL